MFNINDAIMTRYSRFERRNSHYTSDNNNNVVETFVFHRIFHGPLSCDDVKTSWNRPCVPFSFFFFSVTLIHNSRFLSSYLLTVGEALRALNRACLSNFISDGRHRWQSNTNLQVIVRYVAILRKREAFIVRRSPHKTIWNLKSRNSSPDQSTN